MYNNIDNKFIYDNTNVGFTFQFFSPKTRKKLATKLSNYLGMTVIPAKSHRKIKLIDETIYISPDYSGGHKMNRIDTCIMPYHEAVNVMLRCMNFINEYGFTNNRSNMNIKISLNEMDLNLKYKIQNLNIFKYILNLNENHIFKMWPAVSSEKEKIHQSKAIFVYPKNLYSHRMTGTLLEKANPLEYNFPTSSHFGNDFSKLQDGYMSVKYAGGKNYQKKKEQAVDLINYSAKHLYSTLKENREFSIDEKRKISKVLEKYQRSIDNTKNYSVFKHMYPEIELYVDLKGFKYLVESNYTLMRNKIFQLIACCEMKEAIINYDTQRKRVQVKRATIKKGFSLEEIDFFDCKIEADLTNCLIENCTIRNSTLKGCEIYSSNNIKYSKIFKGKYKGALNEIRSTYIDADSNHMINGELKNCVVLNGNFSRESTIDSSTELINKG